MGGVLITFDFLTGFAFEYQKLNIHLNVVARYLLVVTFCVDFPTPHLARQSVDFMSFQYSINGGIRDSHLMVSSASILKPRDSNKSFPDLSRMRRSLPRAGAQSARFETPLISSCVARKPSFRNPGQTLLLQLAEAVTKERGELLGATAAQGLPGRFALPVQGPDSGRQPDPRQMDRKHAPCRHGGRLTSNGTPRLAWRAFHADLSWPEFGVRS